MDLIYIKDADGIWVTADGVCVGPFKTLKGARDYVRKL